MPLCLEVLSLQRFSQLLGTGGVGATPPRRGFTPAPRIQTARKVLYVGIVPV